MNSSCVARYPQYQGGVPSRFQTAAQQLRRGPCMCSCNDCPKWQAAPPVRAPAPCPPCAQACRGACSGPGCGPRPCPPRSGMGMCLQSGSAEAEGAANACIAHAMAGTDMATYGCGSAAVGTAPPCSGPCSGAFPPGARPVH